MSTTQLPAPAGRESTAGRTPVVTSRVTTPRVIRSEWIKLRTLRSTWITAAAIVLVIVGFGVLSALVANGDVSPGGRGGGPRTQRSPVESVLAGANIAILIVAVLGSVIGAREFSTGMIRTTCAAVPRRLPVLWGKLIGFCAVVVPVVLPAVVIAFFTGMAVRHAGGSATVAWSSDGVARTVLGTGYEIIGLGLIGLALGILLRNTAAAIGTVIGAVLFLPTLATALLPDSWSEVLKYLPSNAADAFASTTSSSDTLSSGAGFVVFTAWIALAIAAAATALLRRDA